jgi:acyl-CoA synthetase (NDP forming)
MWGTNKPATRNNNDKVAALLNPRNVVILGATDKPGSWTTRVFRNLQRYNFPGKILPMNPGRDTVWDVKCYRSYGELPEKPDHIVVLVPAAAVPASLREAAQAGARSATIISSGFEEAESGKGKAIAAELRQVIEETGIAVSGPNCLGNISAAAHLVTMPDDRPQRVLPGGVAIIGQSGGLLMAIKRTLEERGCDVGYIITSGNETGLTNADYIRYFAADPQTKVIVSYLESIHDADAFLSACREARAAGKPVVVMKLGASAEGRAAAMAHTGALAGAMEAFDAVAGAAGVIRARNMDEVVELVEYFVYAGLPKGAGLGAVTFSGGLRGLLLDAASNNGLKFAELAPQTRDKLSKILGVGSIVGNPLDSGFAALSSQQAYLDCVEAMLADPGIDIVLLQEELPRAAEGSERKISNLREVEKIAARGGKPISYVSMISYGLSEHSRQLHSELPHLPFLQEPDKTLRTIRNVTDYAARKAGATKAPRATAGKPPAIAQRIRKSASEATQARALTEVESKALLKAYGVKLPKEAVAETPAAAAREAKTIGFPVVMKAISEEITHKSDAGAVLLGIDSPAAVRKGFETILKNVRRYKRSAKVEGMLIAQQVGGGIELVLGVARDPEVGPVVMVGSGGVNLELYKDVAFSMPVTDEAAADALIGRTKAAKLLDGYRGAGPYDRKAVVKALVALSRIALDLGDVIESIDVNPFVALPKGKGGIALDALVILRGGDRP